MITYETFLEGNTAINASNATVIGFGTIDRENKTETLYAINYDGRIKTTGAIELTDSFNAPDRKWYTTYEIPAHAEFIGNYATDMF